MRRIALALPEAVEIRDRHGIWFNVRKKTFALYGMPSGRWILKLPKEQVKMLTEVAPAVFSPMIAGALYWAYVDVEKLTPAELRGYLTAAWRNTTPKKLHALLPTE
jgi:hypothetical protein